MTGREHGGAGAGESVNLSSSAWVTVQIYNFPLYTYTLCIFFSVGVTIFKKMNEVPGSGHSLL
jgi:hypothetical protein